MRAKLLRLRRKTCFEYRRIDLLLFTGQKASQSFYFSDHIGRVQAEAAGSPRALTEVFEV